MLEACVLGSLSSFRNPLPYLGSVPEGCAFPAAETKTKSPKKGAPTLLEAKPRRQTPRLPSDPYLVVFPSVSERRARVSQGLANTGAPPAQHEMRGLDVCQRRVRQRLRASHSGKRNVFNTYVEIYPHYKQRSEGKAAGLAS